MHAVVSILVLASAAGTAVGTIAITVAPRWRRILRLIAGQREHDAVVVVATTTTRPRCLTAQPAKGSTR